ncbi:MAG: glycosyltransferase family 2 protein [Bacteroidetes bacterium]|nr:glycosyltransferase family 2 protein [Bacteroidota bacterium]MBU1717696.1 glycosyltransferase family 2 protein [Bacteroidota bacterium]
MKLSVVIVNYNVKFFLEQCLLSVREAAKGIDYEVFVVDNNSVDGSLKMVREKFPEVQIIANDQNFGFSKANNQAIRIAKGEYILLLNPDTVVEQETFAKTIAFMDSHPDAGGLGVKMVDGKGRFLPESKRGLPTPGVAFWKISGLSGIFPKSRLFGRYHLGFLDKDQTNEVQVLSGAFMMMRKSVLDKAGYLDESFFMYGEDIDLSYRIILAGFKNYYFPETRIIHYKGESTKKSSINYVFVFYRAMIIFARKHFSQSNAAMFSFLINLAIWFRASVAIVMRMVKKAFLPLLDAALIFIGMFVLKEYWEILVKSSESGYYPEYYITLIVPSYIFVWMISIYFFGGYDKPLNQLKVLKGIVTGTLLVLVIYALLPETYRFSRALILLGALWAIISTIGARGLLHLSRIKSFRIGSTVDRRFIIVGEKEEAERVLALMRETIPVQGHIGIVHPDASSPRNGGYIGNANQLAEIIMIYSISEIVFCAKNLNPQRIIDMMSSLGSKQVDFKIAPQESLFIIGSNSVHTTGELYGVSVNAITRPENLRSKRILDIIVSIIFLVFFPVMMFLARNPVFLFVNIFRVFAGNLSWVGYCQVGIEEAEAAGYRLPQIRRGVLSQIDALSISDLSADTRMRLNILYARDYKPEKDLEIIFRAIRKTGRNIR